MNRAVLLLTVAVVILFVGVPAWMCPRTRVLVWNAQAQEPHGSGDKVTLAYVNTTHAILAGVALNQGYYRREGLDVASRLHSFGKSALGDVLEGKADFATAADLPIMMAIMEGEKISIVATIQTSNKDNAIVARKASGIRRPADLKGKKIAAALGTTSDFFMEAFLVAHRIDPKDVKKVDLKPELLRDALMNGDVDAVSAFQPFLIQIQKNLRDRIVWFYDKKIYTWTFSVVAKQEFIRKNPEKVKKLLRALVKAEEFVNRNPVQAQKIVADFSGLDIGSVREIWSHMSFKVSLDQSLVLALEDESRWAINRGIISRRKIPNYLDFIYFDGLESIKPNGVRILR